MSRAKGKELIMSEQSENILALAKVMARKDGQKWEDLDEVMQRAYTHNASVAVEHARRQQEESEAMVKALQEAHMSPEPPEGQCPACMGRGFIELEAGLVRQQCAVCAGSGKVDGSPKTPEEPAKAPPETPKVKPDVIPANQYWCTKCQMLHRDDSKIGIRHSKYVG